MRSLIEKRENFWPNENSEGQAIARSPAEICEFWRWFGDSVVVDDQHRPLVAYRGEHGPIEHSGEFQSRLGSLSFGSAQAAAVYAKIPNRHEIDPFAHTPRVIAAYLRIEKPTFIEPSDPYVELNRLSQIFGDDLLPEIVDEFTDAIMNTSNWIEYFDEFMNPRQVARDAPEQFGDLYFLIYELLDRPKWIERLKVAGFDGAIHCGSGETAFESEYKVFSHDQAWRISCSMIDAR